MRSTSSGRSWAGRTPPGIRVGNSGKGEIHGGDAADALHGEDGIDDVEGGDNRGDSADSVYGGDSSDSLPGEAGVDGIQSWRDGSIDEALSGGGYDRCDVDRFDNAVCEIIDYP